MNDENRDRSEGDRKQTTGAAKETIGQALGDKKLETDGIADQAEGTIENAANEGKSRVNDAKNG